MANNYCLSSSFMEIPPNKMVRVADILDRIFKEMEDADEDDCVGFNIVTEKTGIWFYHDESFTPEQCERIAKALIEELVLDKPFLCSWAYACSKPRIDGFGGGAFLVVKGQETYWCDAVSAVEKMAKIT